MTPEQLETIFLPFEQVGEVYRKSEGTGLGLTISQKIAVMLGTELQVRSHLGEGSVFWLDVILPLAREYEQVQSHEYQKIAGIQQGSSTLLIVDDNPENRSLVTTFLDSLGFKVLEASNGQEGLVMATRHQPDLIVTDLSMPIMDGFELMRRLRTHPDLRLVPIVVASASVFGADRQRSLDAGANTFLPKPIQMDDLLAAIKRYLQLEWTYKQETQTDLPDEISEESEVATQIIAPAPAVLNQLYHFAMMGDLQAIEDKLNQLEAEDAKLIPFIGEVRTLSDSFQTKKIRELLKAYTPAEHLS
jgi:CheY-like chemotaxis protein